MRLRQSTCTVDGCEGVHFARGWCSKHYSRWYQYGTLTSQYNPEVCKQGHPRTPDSRLPNGACKTCANERTKAWRKSNWAEYREINQARYARDREKVKGRARRWQEANPEKMQDARRRRRYGGNDRETIAYVEILRSDPCVYCAGAGRTVDHIDPVSRGGANHWSNYAGACLSCNAQKHTMTLLTFLVRDGIRKV